MPVGDAAYFTVRSRDVLTSHHPLLGAWSSGSSVVGVTVNNLGPLQLDLLAPFTKVSAYLGTAAGSAAINAACIALVWLLARRLVGALRVAAVMAGTTLFTATLGLAWLIDARQQFALVIPFYALLWATVAMWQGVAIAVPIAMALGSLTLQTHFTYAYQTLAVVIVAVIAFIVVRRRDGASLRPLAWGAVVLAVCWVQPVIDQFFGTGNLGTVLGPARDGRAGAGFSAGVQVVAGGALVPPFWLPGSIGTFLQPHDGVTLAGAVTAVVAWCLAATMLIWAGARHRLGLPVAIGATAISAIGASLLAARSIPVSMFGLVPQNYYWVWALGAFISIALAVGASTIPAVAAPLRRAPAIAVLSVVVLATVLGLAIWPRYPVASVRWDESELDRLGRPLRSAIESGLRSDLVDDTVEVDLSRAFFGNNYPYVMLVELQRAGIEFRFPPDSRDLDRFGSSRCAEPGRYQRILLIVGRQPELDPDAVVLAEVVGITRAELREHGELQRKFGDLLRDGTVVVDFDAVADELGDDATAVASVIATPDAPADGLARLLDHWRSWGHVDMPSPVSAELDRWFELERRATSDFQTVVLENPTSGETARC